MFVLDHAEAHHRPCSEPKVSASCARLGWAQAAARFGLRVGATWLGMTAGLGATLVATEIFDVNGLPALPGIALGFLLPNCDLLWRALRNREAPAEQPSSD